MDAKELIKNGLEGFSVREMTEVFVADEHGIRVLTTPVGLFADEPTARAFFHGKTDNYYRVGQVTVLTNEKDGFVLEESAPVFNTESVMTEAREKILSSRLSPSERVILGFPVKQTE
jgi:hypothetical protein